MWHLCPASRETLSTPRIASPTFFHGRPRGHSAAAAVPGRTYALDGGRGRCHYVSACRRLTGMNVRRGACCQLLKVESA